MEVDGISGTGNVAGPVQQAYLSRIALFTDEVSLRIQEASQVMATRGTRVSAHTCSKGVASLRLLRDFAANLYLALPYPEEQRKSRALNDLGACILVKSTKLRNLGYFTTHPISVTRSIRTSPPSIQGREMDPFPKADVVSALMIEVPVDLMVSATVTVMTLSICQRVCDSWWLMLI